jgi:predicted esterase
VSVHALGFSQGAATVSRWAALGRARIDRLVLWGGELPPDLDLGLESAAARLRAARLTLVHGRDDGYITPKIVAEIAARLSRYGIPYEEIAFAGGHALEEAVLQRLAAT